MNQDAILRARVLLLGTGELTALQRVTAHRLLAADSPAVHLPKLSTALVDLAERTGHLPDACLALLDEAIAAAEAMDAADPYRPQVLAEALDARQLQLDAMGRTAR
ncbi:hypothetical protein [Kitasatospora sp. NPDC051914]|uniref:hypothetical protein n=1 Tax=Kitasatospora sp. NPDC051914 TaxID=3154945 RepID=UPI0034121E9B